MRPRARGAPQKTGGGQRRCRDGMTLRREGRETTGARVAQSPRRAGRRTDCQAERGGRAHEVSQTGTGSAPGRLRPTTCTRPARQTGHRMISTPAQRSIAQAATAFREGLPTIYASFPKGKGGVVVWSGSEAR